MLQALSRVHMCWPLITLPHGEPYRAGSGANEASEDDPNLLYDGVAYTLVSLLLRNAQHLQ
jgi:hypothetical protein